MTAVPEFKNKSGVRILQIAEDAADREISHSALTAAHAERDADLQGRWGRGLHLEWLARRTFVMALHPVASVAAKESFSTLRNITEEIAPNRVLGLRAERAHLFVMQEVLGNLLRSPLQIHSSSSLANLGNGIYTDRAFDRLPILADALEEAGCTDTEVLAHCRGPGPHVRGCWVVDLILGKE
jgi:hypothetical protein